MITELTEKNRSRSLYEEAFEDPEIFVDYYYEEKCTDNRIIVCEENGEVISMLHLNPFKLSLCGKEVPVYYVVAVATKEGYRHQGYMSKVFEKTFELLKQEHIPFVYLLPVDEAIYSWMGFEKICDFTFEKYKDYEYVKRNYDVFCIRDEAYLRRMNREIELGDGGNGSIFPENSIIMAKITDLDAFKLASGQQFSSEKEALNWLKSKKIYICEEV